MAAPPAHSVDSRGLGRTHRLRPEAVPPPLFRRRKIAGKVAFLVLLLLAVVTGSLAGLMLVFSVNLPQINDLEHYRPSTMTDLYDCKGRVIGSFGEIQDLRAEPVEAVDEFAGMAEHPEDVELRQLLVGLCRRVPAPCRCRNRECGPLRFLSLKSGARRPQRDQRLRRGIDCRARIEQRDVFALRPVSARGRHNAANADRRTGRAR